MAASVKLDVWYDKGLSFTCTQCGNCCTGGPGYVWISDEEVARLAEHLKLSEKETRRRHIRRVAGGQSLKEIKRAGKYDCAFLTGEPGGKRGCSIYDARPLQCRTWPFWPENLTEDGWDDAKQTCPGLGKGTRYTAKQIEAIRDAADWPERPPSSTPPTATIRKLPSRHTKATT